MDRSEPADGSVAMRFLARMAPQTDGVAGPVVRCEVLAPGISGAAVCRVRFANLTGVLKITLPENGEVAVERAGRELAFYRHLAGRVPVRVPHLLAAYDGPEGIALLLPAYQPSPPASEWPEVNYLEVARQLALLHAAFWARTQELADFTWLRRRRPDDVHKDVISAAASWQSLREQPRFANVLPDPTLQSIMGMLSRLDTGDEMMPDMPLTLCHGDSNPLNLLRDSDGRLVWVDWQEVGPARGPEDLSFFIQRASAEAEVEVPRDRMMAEYCDELRRATGKDIALDTVRQVVEVAELRSYLLYWPTYMAQVGEERLRAMLERIGVLAQALELP